MVDIEKGVYNYGELSTDDKTTAEEIIRVLQNNPDVPNDVCKDLRLKFNIEEIPEVFIEDSLWYHFTHEDALGLTVQGWATIDKGTDSYKIPYIGLCNTLDKFDLMILHLFEKARTVDLEDVRSAYRRIWDR